MRKLTSLQPQDLIWPEFAVSVAANPTNVSMVVYNGSSII